MGRNVHLESIDFAVKIEGYGFGYLVLQLNLSNGESSSIYQDPSSDLYGVPLDQLIA